MTQSEEQQSALTLSALNQRQRSLCPRQHVFISALIFAVAVVLTGCVTMTPRYDYTPQSAEGIECKSNCKSIYDSCRNEVLQDCEVTYGNKCKENSLAAGDGVNECRRDEEQCLKVCENSVDG